MEQCPIIPNPNNGRWRVYAEYTYTTTRGIAIRIEEGFETDLASVPSLFRWLFPRCRVDYATASIVHDKLLEMKMGRDYADSVFREILDITATEQVEEILYESVSLWSRVKKWWHG